MPEPFALGVDATQEQTPDVARRTSAAFDALTRPITAYPAERAGEITKAVSGYLGATPEQAEPFAQVSQGFVHTLPRTLMDAVAVFGAKNPWVRALGLGDVALRSYANTEPSE